MFIFFLAKRKPHIIYTWGFDHPAQWPQNTKNTNHSYGVDRPPPRGAGDDFQLPGAQLTRPAGAINGVPNIQVCKSTYQQL